MIASFLLFSLLQQDFPAQPHLVALYFPRFCLFLLITFSLLLPSRMSISSPIITTAILSLRSVWNTFVRSSGKRHHFFNKWRPIPSSLGYFHHHFHLLLPHLLRLHAAPVRVALVFNQIGYSHKKQHGQYVKSFSTTLSSPFRRRAGMNSPHIFSTTFRLCLWSLLALRTFSKRSSSCLSSVKFNSVRFQ
jgi:hypothetical protein